MVNIIETSKELTKIEKYKMTMSPEIISMKDVPDGTIISVEAYLTFEDDGKEIYSILASDGKCYAYQSLTFHDSLCSIHEIMKEEDGTVPVYEIKKISGETKAGRNFINCVLNA